MSAFAVSVTLQLFKQPTFSGGTPVVIENYNDINPVATTITVAKGVTVTSSGTPWGDLIQLNGSSQSASRTTSGLAPGGDRILKPNSTYLITISNLDTNGTAIIDYYLTWFEGVPDLPRS